MAAETKPARIMCCSSKERVTYEMPRWVYDLVTCSLEAQAIMVRGCRSGGKSWATDVPSTIRVLERGLGIALPYREIGREKTKSGTEAIRGHKASFMWSEDPLTQ